MHVETQLIDISSYVPGPEKISNWVGACPVPGHFAEMTLRIVSPDEIQCLNRDYRQVDKATNVLSFPAFDDSLPSELNDNLGDLVICADVVNAEAQSFGMDADQRWSHMVVHGVLHLLGYDHIDESDRMVMEREECRILALLGLSDPYTIA